MKPNLSLLILGLLAIKLIFLPTEYTGDSYGYACEIIKGDWISGHHLLHKYGVGSIWKILQIIGIQSNPLQVGIILNALFGAFSLMVLNRILKSKKYPSTSRWNWILFTASCFVFIRYTSENETYIFPIFFALLGWHQQLRGNPWISMLSYLIAVGFHQTYLIVCAPLIWNPSLAPTENNNPIKLKFKSLYRRIDFNFKGIRRAIIFLFMVLGGYGIAAYFYELTFVNLFFQDVQSGLVQTTPGFKNLIFAIINSIRIFVQIHGELSYQILHTWPIWLGFIALIIYLIVQIILFKKTSQKDANPEWDSAINLNVVPRQPISIGPVFSLIFTWLFALYSVGNLEFMVFIPFLIALISSEFSHKNLQSFPIENHHSKPNSNFNSNLKFILNSKIHPNSSNIANLKSNSNSNSNSNWDSSSTHFKKMIPFFTIQRMSVILFIWNFSVYTLPHSLYVTQDLESLRIQTQNTIKKTSESGITINLKHSSPFNSMYFITPQAALMENYSEFKHLTRSTPKHPNNTSYQQRFFHNQDELMQFLQPLNHPPKQNVKYIIISDNRGIERSNMSKIFNSNTEIASPEKPKKQRKSWVNYEFSEIHNLVIP
jgi:hypothetical protein